MINKDKTRCERGLAAYCWLYIVPCRNLLKATFVAHFGIVGAVRPSVIPCPESSIHSADLQEEGIRRLVHTAMQLNGSRKGGGRILRHAVTDRRPHTYCRLVFPEHGNSLKGISIRIHPVYPRE